jgi:hypothetical protein
LGVGIDGIVNESKGREVHMDGNNIRHGEKNESTFEGRRQSNIELFRIVTMLCIVAHHYIVNSGVYDEITQANVLEPKSIFALIFGWGGKTGIDCFVLITGYFMCKSNITVKKFLKLLLEIEFYKIVIYLIFLLSGYSPFTLKGFIKAMLPVYSIGTGFGGSYLVFFLFIPYLNKLIQIMDEREHRKLIVLCIIVDSVLQTFLKAPEAFTYVGLFMMLYFISSYIRLYPKALFENGKVWGWAVLITLLLSWLSVLCCGFIYHMTGKKLVYYFVADSNKLLAVITAVSAFMFFKNLKMKYHPAINAIAGSAFGVLMIHANSDTMRQWLWRDVLDNVGSFNSDYFVIHAVVSVVAVYAVCTLIDMVRIRVLERPFFNGMKKWGDIYAKI